MSASTLLRMGLTPGARIQGFFKRGLASYTNLPEPPASGFQEQTCTTTSFTGDSLQQGSTPAVAIGDVFYLQTLATPSRYAIVPAGDGTVEIVSGGDTSRQSFQYFILRAASNTLDGPGEIFINEIGPVWNGSLLFAGGLALNTPVAPINLAAFTYATSPEGDALTFAVASGTLPPGLSLSSAGLLTGIVVTAGAFSFTISATDSTGTAALQAFQVIVSPVVIETPPPFVAPAPQVRGRQISWDAVCRMAGRPGTEHYPVYQFGGGQIQRIFTEPV